MQYLYKDQPPLRYSHTPLGIHLLPLRYLLRTRELKNVAVVSPDAGGVARAKMFREGLEAQVCINGLYKALDNTDSSSDSASQKQKKLSPNSGACANNTLHK